jgi:hypothetical protein
MAGKSITDQGYSAPNVTDDNPEKEVAADYVPEGYESQAEFLKYARDLYTVDIEYDKENRDMALDDLKFIAGDQWDPDVKAAREGRPIITINTLPQYVGQVIGDRRMNKTNIKIVASRDATAEMAQTRSGIIKAIEQNSRAERSYDMALEDQVSCGIGNLRVNMDYADDSAFDQDLFINHIPNPLAVVWDRMAVDPTARDAGHCFVQDNIPQTVFDKDWKDFKPDNAMIEELGLAGSGWFSNNMVRVTEFWEMLSRPRFMALDKTGGPCEYDSQEEVDQALEAGELWTDPQTNKPKVRVGRHRYARMHLITGTDILAGPYELPINRLPIVRVEGRIVRVGDDRYRYSLVRWAKDSARMRNYWRSVWVEKLAMAPKAKWLAEDAAVEGYEDDFRDAHLSQDSLLKYKQGTKQPILVPPPPIEAALINAETMNNQDIKDTTGLQDASLGIRSNEVSGRAINARKMEGDVATVIYHDNLNYAIQEIGDVTNQLLGVCYDTLRSLPYIGEDEKRKQVAVNDPSDPDSVDLSKGAFGTEVDTGPSFTTQRAESAQAMMEAIKVAPNLMDLAGDLIVKAQDWPGAIEIAERIKQMMKAKGLPTGDEEDQQQIDPQMVEQIKQAALKEFMDSQQGQALQLENATKQEELRQAKADADKAEADAEKSELEAEAYPDIKAAEIAAKHAQTRATPRNSNESGVPRRAVRPQKRKGNTK